MRFILIIIVLFLSGCTVPNEFVRNEDKSQWNTYGDEWWVQGMEIDTEILLRRVDIESDM